MRGKLSKYSCRILVAEDDEDIQNLVRGILERAGAVQVLVVDDGDKPAFAVESAQKRNEPFDLLLFDINMPSQDGCSAAKEIRENGYSGLMMAMSLPTVPGEDEMSRHYGFDTYFDKSQGFKELVDRIVELFESKKASE